jgi:hypothetical protein
MIGDSRFKLTPGSKALAVAGAALLMGFSINAQAQCTTVNWDDRVGFAEVTSHVGNQNFNATNNRRAAGPCGLRVPLDGDSRYVTHESPSGETTFKVRFYAFLNNAGTEEMVIYAATDGPATDGSDDRIQVIYNLPTPGDLTLRVFDSSDTAHDLVQSGIASRWHSIIVEWEASPTAEIRFGLSDNLANDAVSDPIDTSGIQLVAAHLGNLSQIDNGGSIDYDDYDARRLTRPEVFCRGDTTGSNSLGNQDANNIIAEVSSFGANSAQGQPDFDRDGLIRNQDANAILARVASLNFSCPSND